MSGCDPTGRRSGQQLLNAFVEPLALDLPRFMDASDKEKADILLRIIGIGSELHTRDLEIKGLYDKRTFTGQLAQQKKYFADELISYPVRSTTTPLERVTRRWAGATAPSRWAAFGRNFSPPSAHASASRTLVLP